MDFSAVIQQPPSRGWFSRYGPAVFLCAVSIAEREAAGPGRDSGTTLLCFMFATVLSAWWGGLGPGLLATVLTTLAGVLLFGVVELKSGDALWDVALYFSAAVAISLMAGALRRTASRERAQRDALSASEERLRLAVTATQDTIWDWDIVRGTLAWSPAVTEQFGWPAVPPGTPPTWWQERLHDDDREAVLHGLRAVVADPAQHHWQAEYRFRRADGSMAEVFDRGTVLRDAGGRAVRMIGAMLDQTERLRVEAESRRAREQIQTIIDTVPALISYIDRDYIYRWNSRSYERWFNRPLARVTDHPMPEVLGEEAFARIKPFLDRAFGGEETVFEDFLPYEKVAGRWVHAVYAPHRTPDGRVDGVAISVSDITERRHAEITRAALAAIVENSDDAIMGTTLDGVVTSWNRAAERLFGYSALEMIGSGVQRLFPPEHPHEGETILEAMREGRPLEHNESLQRTKDGRLINVAVTASPIHDASGAVVGISKIVRDITAQIRAQQALRESERRWRELAEAMPHLVWTCRPDGACDFIGGQWLAYTGRAEADQLGYGWLSAVHPEDRENVRRAWEHAAHSGTIFDVEFRVQRHDGEFRWFKTRAVPARDTVGRVAKWYGSNTDIEELKRAEAAAWDAASQRTLALDAAGMGAWDWNIRAGTIVWSDRAFQLFGVAKTETPTYELFLGCVHPDDRERVHATLQQSIATPSFHYQCEYRVLQADGSVRWLFGKGAAQVDPASGEPAHMVGITADVTERVLGARRLANARDAAEAANRAKDAFLAALSHELRTPLTPVLFLAATLERSSEVPPALREDFAMIRRNVELEARLIDDLLDLTRITRGKLQLDFEPTDVHAILRRSIELLQNDVAARRITLEVDLAAPRCEAQADSVRLQQVFWNVLKNAVKFTPEHGRVTVRSRVSGERWRVSVNDSGLGITEEELPRIFEAFSQGEEASSHRFGGLGLGLAISSLLVREHHGRIWAESPGRHAGSTFHIELPLLADGSVSPDDAPPAGPSADGTAQRILVVEDHEPTRLTLQRLLMRRGYQVEVAATAGAARTLAARAPFCLMISDLGLPDGSGHDLAEEFRRDYSLRAIALSGYGMEEDVRRSIDAGFLAHITKPVDIEALLEAIARALGVEI